MSSRNQDSNSNLELAGIKLSLRKKIATVVISVDDFVCVSCVSHIYSMMFLCVSVYMFVCVGVCMQPPLSPTPSTAAGKPGRSKNRFARIGRQGTGCSLLLHNKAKGPLELPAPRLNSTAKTRR